MRALSRDEERIADVIAAKLLELEKVGHRPTHVAVNRMMFLGCGLLHGLAVIRAGYIKKDEAALLLITDDIGRWRVPMVRLEAE